MDIVFVIVMMFLSFIAGILFGYFNRDDQEEYDFDQGYTAGWSDAFELMAAPESETRAS